MAGLKQDKKTIVTTIDLKTAALMNEKVQKMNSTKSALVRTAIKEYLEDGINTPALTFSVVQMVSEIEKLERTIPEEDFQKLENSVQNVIHCLGGNCYGSDTDM